MALGVRVIGVPSSKHEYAAKYFREWADLDAAVVSNELTISADRATGPLYRPLHLVASGVAQPAALDELEAWFMKFPWINPMLMDWTWFQANFFEKFPRQKHLGVRLYKLQFPFFHARPRDIKRVVQILAPHLIELAEVSDVWFVCQSQLVSKRLALIRILHAAKSFPEMMEQPIDKFGGFQALERLQPTSDLGPSIALNFLLSLFTPFLTGFAGDQIGGSYVYILREQKPYSVDFPPRLQDLVRPDTKVLKEDKSIEELEAMVKKSPAFTAAQLQSVFLDFVTEWGRLQSEMLNPLRFSDGAGLLDVRRWHLTYSTAARIFIDATLAQTEYLSQYSRKLMAFRTLDAISQLLSKHPIMLAQQRNRLGGRCGEREIFKQLLSKSVSLGKYGPELAKYPAPFGNLFRNQNRTAIGDVYEKVLAGVFVPGARANGGVRVAGQLIPNDDYVQSFLREVRNTQHGYNIKRFEVIQVHNGNVPDSLGDLAKFAILAWLRSPDLLLDAEVLSY